MDSNKRILPQNKYWYVHILVMALITIGLFAGFFKKNTMMTSSDQVNALGIKSPIRQSLTEDGQLAEWNRGMLGGMPTGDALAGDYMYPPAIALTYVAPEYTVFGIKMILHIFVAGLFFYLMLWRGFAFPPSIAAIGAIFYMLNPQFVSHIAPGHDGKMYVIAWLPFMVWHLKRIADKPNLLSTTLFGLGLGMALLSSHIQMTYFVLWGLFAYWLMHTITTLVRTKNIKSIIGISAGFWGGVAIGMALGAVQFLPAYLFVQEHFSVRGADRTIETAASWSLHWAEVFSLWVPELGNWFGYYWGDNHFKLNTEYAGAIALFFAIFAIIRKPGKWRIFWSVVALFSVAISLGLHTPIFRISYAIIPGVKKFRALSMFMFWFSFSTVILAVSFLKDIFNEFWAEKTPKIQKYWQNGVLITLAVVTVISVLFAIEGFTSGLMEALTPSLQESTRKQIIFNINFKEQFLPMLGLWWAMISAVLICFYFTLRGMIKKEWFLVIVLLIGSVDLLRVNYKFIKMKDLYLTEDKGKLIPGTYERSIYRSDKQYRRINPEIKKLQKELKEEPFRVIFMPLLKQLGNQNIAGAYNLEGLGGYNDNELITYRTFQSKGGRNYYEAVKNINNMNALNNRLTQGSNLFNVANCKYFIIPHDKEGFNGKKKTEYIVIENSKVLPRLSFTNRFSVGDDDFAMGLLMNKYYSSRDSVILKEAPEGVEPGDSLVTEITTKWDKYTANERIAKVTVPADGILRIAEVWYPGWTISVDGVKIDPIRADVTWMAVPIKKGEHEVVMKIASPFLPIAMRFTFPVAAFILLYWIIYGVKKLIKPKK